MLGKPAIVIELFQFTQFWPNARCGQPIPEKMDCCLSQCFIHARIHINVHLHLVDLRQFVAKALLHCGQCAHIAAQCVIAVQQRHNVGENDAQILHIVNFVGKFKLYVGQQCLDSAQKVNGLPVKMSVIFKSLNLKNKTNPIWMKSNDLILAGIGVCGKSK